MSAACDDASADYVDCGSAPYDDDVEYAYDDEYEFGWPADCAEADLARSDSEARVELGFEPEGGWFWRWWWR